MSFEVPFFPAHASESQPRKTAREFDKLPRQQTAMLSVTVRHRLLFSPPSVLFSIMSFGSYHANRAKVTMLAETGES